MADLALKREGKRLIMGGTVIAECASDGIAAVLQLAVSRSRITQREADLFEVVFK